MALTQVISAGVKDGELVNADINSSASIALSKISIDGDKGDITVSSSGASWAIDANAITAVKIATGAVTGSEIGADAVGSQHLAPGGVDTTAIAADAVTFAKMNNISADRLVGRVGGGTGDIGTLTAAQTRSFLGLAASATTDTTNASNISSGTVAAARLDTATTQSAGNNSTKIATTAYADTAISNLVDSSPSALNTLNELAAALGDDANFSTTVTNSIATKAVLSGSTNNQIATVTGANALQGEANLTFDGTNLGIGVSSPSRVLQIKSAGANAAQIGLIDNDSTNEVFQVGQQSDGDCFVSIKADDGTTKISFDASGDSFLNGGNVGIGETVPDRQLHVKSGANSNDGALRIESATGNIMDTGTDSTGHFLNCVNADPFRVKFAGTEKLRITSDGDILAGTTSLASSTLVDGSTAITPTLQLDGTGTSANTSGVINLSRKTGSGGSLIYSSGDDGGLCLRNTDGNGITLLNGTTKAVRIASDGDVGIGTTSNYAESPLEVRSTNNGGDVAIRVTNHTTTDGSLSGVIFTTSTADFTSAAIAHKRNDNALILYNGQSSGGGGFSNATERMRIKDNGDVLWNGVSTNVPGHGNTTFGMAFEPRNGSVFLSRADNTCLFLNRGNDGEIMSLSRAGVAKAKLKIDGVNDLVFSTGSNGAEDVLRLDSAGNITIHSDNGNNADTNTVTWRGGSSSQKANFARAHSKMVSNWGGEFWLKVKGANGSLSDNWHTAVFVADSGAVRKPRNPQCLARRTTEITLNHGGQNHTYNVEMWDVQGNYSTSTGKFVCPNDGYYYMNHTVAVKGSNSGCLEAKIKINDSEVIRDYIYYEGGQAGGTSTASAIRWCDKDDEIRPATHWSGSSGTGTHCQDNANPICFFQVVMVS